MPASWTEKRIDAAWPAISAAVQTGLEAKGTTKLVDVLNVVTAPLEEKGRRFTHDRLVPWASRLIVTCDEERRGRRVAHRSFISVDDLLHDDTIRSVADWAAEARRFERDFVLRVLCSESEAVSSERIRWCQLTGWGERTVVDWGNPALDEKDLSAHETRLIRAPNATGLLSRHRAVGFRDGGGPEIRRAEDLTLDWLPHVDGRVALILHQRLDVVNAHLAIPVNR